MKISDAYGLYIFFSWAGGLEIFTELLQRFPNNVHLLLEVAKVRKMGVNQNLCLYLDLPVTKL